MTKMENLLTGFRCHMVTPQLAEPHTERAKKVFTAMNGLRIRDAISVLEACENALLFSSLEIEFSKEEQMLEEKVDEFLAQP